MAAVLLAGTRCTGDGSPGRPAGAAPDAAGVPGAELPAAEASGEMRPPAPRGDTSAPPAPVSGPRADGPQGPTLACEPVHYADGDSFRCRDGRRVRLLGIDAPELDQGGGPAARASLERLLPRGRPVRLETDVQPEDRHGRTLAYAWTADGLVNEAQVRAGMATLLTYAPNVRYVARLRAAQAAARRERTGLWAGDAFRCSPREHRQGRC